MADPRESGPQALALELVRYAVHGTLLSFGEIEPLLRHLLPRQAAGAGGCTLHELACLLQGRVEPEARALAEQLHSAILNEAVQAGQMRRDNPAHAWHANPALAHLPPEIPAGWRDGDALLVALRQTAQLERDRAFLAAAAPERIQPRLAVESALARKQEQLRRLTARWAVLPPALVWAGFTPPPGCVLPEGAATDPRAEADARLAELATLAAAPAAATSGGVPDAALKRLLAWPDAGAAPFILQGCPTPSAQHVAMSALAVRSGMEYRGWWEWESWLKRAAAAAAQTRAAADRMAGDFRDELRLIWLREQPGTPDAALETALTAAVAESARRNVRPAEFVRRWEHALTPAEVAQLGGGSAVAPPLPPVAGAAAATTNSQSQMADSRQQPALETRQSALETRKLESENPPPPPAPSVWDEHIQPFLAANWYILAGLLMVVAGASLLAYFTWDKSVLVRYLFLPVLLAAFTGGMAELGLRLYRRHEELRATGGFLLGGAVCLLPVNFMVLCRAGGDPQAASLLLPALVLYTTLAGVGLWRWCGEIRAELRLLLALPLLAVNLLAVLGDMPGIREAAASHRPTLIPATITAAVLLMLAVSNRFLRLVLTKELLETKIVPWFFGVTLAATALQVAAWRHFHLHITPKPQDYALAMILVGATFLRWERRACELRSTGSAYGGESFIGYAALLFGILMAAGNEWLRILALLLVGVIWLVQAPRRPGSVHYWIGFTLCLLGGAAIGMLASFPKSRELNLLPELGLALALAAGAVRALAGRLGEPRLRKVAFEIQPPILLLTAIIAILSQYNLRSEPWQSGTILLVVAGFFAVRASVAARKDWLRIAAACAGLSLPYLGCADMVNYRFDGNTLALGLGILSAAWLAAARLLRSATWRRTGDRILTAFGIAGIAGLLLRLLLADRPEIAGAELAGGALLAVTLGVTAWHARRLLPGMLAAGTLAVVLPLFRVPADAVPAWLHFGTGLVSAAAALVLVLAAFALRWWGRPGVPLPGLVAHDETTDDCIKGLAFVIVPVLSAAFWLCGKALILQFQRHPDQMPFILSILLVSATFYAAAIYFRNHAAGKFLFHASWPLLGAGITMACDHAGCREWGMFQYPLLWTGVALTVLLAAEFAISRRLEWMKEFLVRPRLALLAYGSAVVAVLVAFFVQDPHLNRSDVHWLALFSAAQLAWHGLRSAQRRFGAVLFVLIVSWLSLANDLPFSMGAAPVFLMAVLLADITLESLPKPRAFLNPLRTPFVAGVTVVATVLAIMAIFSVSCERGEWHHMVYPSHETVLVFIALLLVGRAQACAGFAVLAALLGWLLCLLPCPTAELFRPWRLADFALLLCLLPFLGRMLTARWPRLLCGPEPQLLTLETAPETACKALATGKTAQAPWFFGPGLALAVGAAVAQVGFAVAGHADDTRWVQVFAPFVAVAAFMLAGLYWRKGAFWAVAACLLPAANLFAVAVLWGRDLLDAQLTPVHIIGTALVLTIAEFAAVRRFVLNARSGPAALWLHLGCSGLAGTTLVLLALNYLANPNLAEIPTVRFLASGLLALGAGLYFRTAARRPENLTTQEGLWLEGFWHAALGLALWCGALMIPALRTPHAALYALALPALACWASAEWFRGAGSAEARKNGNTEERKNGNTEDRGMLIAARFTTSAAVFAVLVLILYTFRLPFQMVLFPHAPLELELYHTGAAAAVLMGLVLFRVRGLGGAVWTAFVGGIALMVGTYFGVTWLPGLSPFDFPMAGAWAAVVAAQLLILLSYQQSPLRSLLQHLGGIGAEEWHAHRRLWGLFLTAAVHVAVIAGLVQDYAAHSRHTTPLLLALATVLIHQAVIGAPWAKAYYAVAVLEILAALHLDFILPAGAPGLIPAKQVVWFLLVPWLATALLWRRHLRAHVDAMLVWAAAGGLAVLGTGHLFYHGPETGAGLAISALMVLATLLTPLPENAPAARTVAALMLAEPLWLAYFGTRWGTGDGAAGFRPLLAGAAALLGTGMLVRLKSMLGTPDPGPRTPENRRLVHELIALCRRNGETAARVLLGAAFAALAGITALHADARTGSLGLMLALAFVWGMACVAWFREGRFRDGVLPYTLSVLSLAGAWIVLRRLLFSHFDFWTYEYDIWLSLGASIAFSAAKRMVRHREPGLGRTMAGTVWLLPVLQCIWLLSNRMSADLTLVVIGVQSMLFAWHGGGRRDSPYNGVSMLGFVGFICLLFWAKLDLRCVQAYTIPAGFGVLGLVWLFGDHMKPGLRNAIRLVTVLGMLGSCGYYALLDNSYPTGFHLTMLLLCLAIMALGPLLRIQLYLYLGFAGFATDLVTLVIKQFRALDRSIQMMGVGALLLLLGIAVVGGAILYKTRRDDILARLAKLRAKLGGWE